MHGQTLLAMFGHVRPYLAMHGYGLCSAIFATSSKHECVDLVRYLSLHNFPFFPRPTIPPHHLPYAPPAPTGPFPYPTLRSLILPYPPLSSLTLPHPPNFLYSPLPSLTLPDHLLPSPTRPYPSLRSLGQGYPPLAGFRPSGVTAGCA